MDLTWSRTAKHGATSLSQRPEKGSPEELLYFVPPTEEAFLKLLSERLGCRQQARKAEKVLTFYSSKKGFGPTQRNSKLTVLSTILLFSTDLCTNSIDVHAHIHNGTQVTNFFKILLVAALHSSEYLVE